MMKRIYFRIILFVSSVAMAACSVKEDRGTCPSHLVLDFSSVDTSRVREVSLLMSGKSGTCDLMKFRAEEFYPELRIEAPREELLLNVYAGVDQDWLSDKGMTIPYGEDSPPVYMYVTGLEKLGDEENMRVSLFKNHSRMSVEIVGDVHLSSHMRVVGKVDGYLTDGTPSSGSFSYQLEYEDGKYEVVLPRQMDASLMLEIDDGSGVLKYFAIGEYIAAGGYDWNSPDLEDIEVLIDWASTDISVVIKAWDKVYDCEVVI